MTTATPTVAPTDHHLDAGDAWLGRAATFFVVAVLIHGADHARRGVDATGLDVLALGLSAIPLEVGVVVLICQRHRLAPVAAISVGFGLAVGYLVVHFLPDFGPFSDSLSNATDASALSWGAASLEVVAALTLGTVGLLTLRRRGGLVSATQPHAAQRPLAAALRDPVALVMILGNALLLIVTAFDL